MTNQELFKEIRELKKEIQELKGMKKTVPEIKTYSFSRIDDDDLDDLVDIKQIYTETIFEEWFNFKYEISDEIVDFLQKLLDKNAKFIFNYYEEDLKMNFLAPLINKIDFFMIEDKVRNFYDAPLTYKTDKFIFSGATDFMISSGIKKAKKPYFFIQEFKKSIKPTNPEPQLLAEMISAVELNKTITIRGAFIMGKDWYFVILEKLGKDRYQYFISEAFNSTKIDELKGIYRNLKFVKNEILEMVRKEK